MPRIGRSFPAHTVIGRAGVSNYLVNLSVVSVTVSSLQRQQIKILPVTTATTNSLASIKLKSLQVLSIASATSNSLATKVGKGRILSVTTLTSSNVNRSITKSLSISSQSIISLRKGINKLIGTQGSIIPTYVMRSRIVLNNYDGGIKGLPSTTTTPVPSIVNVFPGLFRIASPKGALKVQFRSFLSSIVKRIVIQ